MVIIPLHHNEIVRRFIACNLPQRSAICLANRLVEIEKHHGILTVVKILKGLQSFFLGHDGGQPLTKKRHEDGTLYGDFRPLSRLALKGRAGLRDALRCVKIYGLFEAQKPEALEFENFRLSLLHTGCDPILTTPLITTPEDKYLADCVKYRFDSKYPLGDTRAPRKGMGSQVEKHYSPEEHMKSLSDFPHLVEDHREFISRLLPINATSIDSPVPQRQDIAGTVVGLTKDRGMKVRFIANPYRTIQLILSRLKNALEDFLKDLPESAVFDQEKGMAWVKTQLLEGKKLSSLDLSSCSDNLPLVFQIELLMKLFPRLSEDITIFQKVSKMDWKTPFRTVCWEKGQPLGTGPSFSSFTIFHIFLIRSLGGHAGNFRVIGDDVVISEPQLAKLYQIAIGKLKVEISMSKSLFDSDLAEFAGRIIDKYGTYHVFKASPMDLSNDPLGLIRQYGEKAMKSVRIPVSFKRHLKLCYRLFYGRLTKDDLAKINGDSLFRVFEKKLPLVSARPVFRQGTKSPEISSGETSGIPPVFIERMIIEDGKARREFRQDYELKPYQSFLFFNSASPSIFDRASFRTAQYPLGLGVWSVDLFDNNQERQHINANIQDHSNDSLPISIGEKAKALEKPVPSFKYENESKPPLQYLKKLAKELTK